MTRQLQSYETSNSKLYVLMFCLILFSYGLADGLIYINWLFGTFLILASVLIILKKKNISLAFVKVYMISVMWLIYCLSVSSFTSDLNNHLKYILITLFFALVSCILVYVLLTNSHRFFHILYYLNFTWLIINLLYYFFVYNKTSVETIYSGIFYNRNTFAILTTILAYLLLYASEKAQIKTKMQKYMYFGSFLLICLTLSIKGIIGFFLLFFGHYFLNKENVLRKLSVLLLIGFVFWGVLTTENPISERVERFTLAFIAPNELKASESAFNRMWLINESINLIKEHPLVGVGVNNSILFLVPPEKVLFEEGKGTYSHNNYTEMLLNGGVPAFLLYYIPILYMLVCLIIRKFPKGIKIHLILLILYKLFIDLAQVSYFDFGMVFIYIYILFSYISLSQGGKADIS